MNEEYNSVLSTPTDADKIGRFGRYQYVGKTQISARYIGQADIYSFKGVKLFYSSAGPQNSANGGTDLVSTEASPFP